MPECVCAKAGERGGGGGRRMREIRGDLKLDSRERRAQIDIAITQKAIPQLGIHLHILESGCSLATFSLRLFLHCLIYKSSVPKGHHWAFAAHKVKTLLVPHVAQRKVKDNVSQSAE